MKKPRKPVSGKTWKKITAAVFSYICICLLLFSCWCGGYLIDQNGYQETREDFRYHRVSDAAVGSIWMLYSMYEDFKDDPYTMDLYGEGTLKNSNIVGAQIFLQDSETPCWTYGETEETDQVSMFRRYMEVSERDSPSEVRLFIQKDLRAMDTMGIRVRAAELLHDLRYVIPVVILALAGVFIWCIWYLLRSAGHRAGKEGILPYWGTKSRETFSWAACGSAVPFSSL